VCTVHLSVCIPVWLILKLIHQGAALDSASVHFGFYVLELRYLCTKDTVPEEMIKMLCC